MPAPTVDWTLVPIHGKYVNFRGAPITTSGDSAHLVVTPEATRATDADQLTTVIGLPFTVDIDDFGVVDDLWPATDDPDITPINFTYHVKEDFPGGIEYDISVPMAAASTGGIQLPTATAVPADPGTALTLSSRVVAVPTGTTGWATQPDGTLWVEYTP